LRFLLHAEPSVCMQEDGGKIIPPRWFLVLGQTCSGPVSFVAGSGWSWPSSAFRVGFGPEEKYQIFVGPGSAQRILGLSPAQFVGPAQPNPIIYYMLCILYCVCIIYI
jgi:hypothetical protein